MTISEHTISRVFYSFKSGFNQYGRLFARGIEKAIANEPKMKIVKFDLMLSVPLSPKKKKLMEFDRTRELCLELSKITGIKYQENGLSLACHISRKEYRKQYGDAKFVEDYCKALTIDTTDLDGKNILIIDDVITDGKTLAAIAIRIREKFPKCTIYGAASAIMLKRPNTTLEADRKFQR